jgi:hypothetical protein
MVCQLNASILKHSAHMTILFNPKQQLSPKGLAVFIFW